MSYRLPIIALVLFIAVIVLGLLATTGFFSAADRAAATTMSLQAGQSRPDLITAMQATSWVGGGTPRWIIVTAICALLLWRGWTRPVVALAATSLASNLVSESLKSLFGRVRPDIVPHLDLATNPAYPSGHATNAAVVYILLALLVPARWRAPAMVAALAMTLLTGFSRIMLGVHWPTDVVGGWMLGTAFALIGVWWVRQDARHAQPIG